MACCARHALVAALLLGAVMLHAPVRGQDTARTAPALGVRAALAFAARWSTAPDDVRIEWHDEADATLAPTDSLAIRGDGANGRFFLEMHDAAGDVQRLWVRAGVVGMVPHAALDLARGTVLDSTQVETREAVMWGGPAHDGIRAVLGWTTRRAVAAGEALEPPAVQPPASVTAGDDVRVIVRRGPVRLAIMARALGTAAAGERVSVRLETGKRMTGIAMPGGTVAVSEREGTP